MALFRRRRWPRAVAAVAVLAVVVAVAVALTRSPPKPAAVPEIVETAEPVPDPTPDSVALAAVLSASDATLRSYADKQVAADGVRVLSVPGPGAAWVGTSASDRVLVVIAGVGQSFAGIAAGTPVSFTGTVRLMDARSGFGKALGLGAADDAELERQRAYVEVTAFESA